MVSAKPHEREPETAETAAAQRTERMSIVSTLHIIDKIIDKNQHSSVSAHRAVNITGVINIVINEQGGHLLLDTNIFLGGYDEI